MRADVNTYDFVKNQGDLIESFLEYDSKSPQNVYALAAAIEQRFEHMLSGATRGSVPNSPISTTVRYATPKQEMQRAALLARSQGKVYSGCGMTLGKDGLPSTREIFDELGYSNDYERELQSESADEDEYGSLTFECPDGHTNRRPRGRLLDKCQRAGCKASVKC
jgi:hypothetical protein